MDIEKVKDTVRKLLNLAANDAAAQGEVDNAMRFAARLMEQHQLTEEDVRLNKVDSKLADIEMAECDKQTSYCAGDSKMANWHTQAAHFACAFVGGIKWFYQSGVMHRENGIVQLDRTGKPKLKTLVTFYGISEDVEVAKQVFDELLLTIIALAKLRFGVVYRGSGRSYCEGFMSGLWNKWYKDQDSQKKLAATSGSTALVVIDQRALIVAKKEERALAWRDETLGKGFKKGRATRASISDYEAHNAGHSDGSQYSASANRRKRLK